MNICGMTPDKKDEDPSRKETQVFDPALIDEDGIHSERLPDTEPEPGGVEQEQRREDDDQERDDRGGWQSFETP